MINYIKTMENCREFLNRGSRRKLAFENMAKSNCSGFEYTLESGIAVKLRVDKGVGFVIFEVYPGITVRGAHQIMTAEYCQRVCKIPDIGYLAVDPDQGNLYYHAESCFEDNPISVALLEKMETEAINALDKHVPILECLAYGKLPAWNLFSKLAQTGTDDTPCLYTAAEQEMLEKNIAAIRKHISFCGHNVVACNMDMDSDVPFFVETMTENDRYRDYFYIVNGFLVRAARIDVKCADVFRTQAAQFANEASDEKKVGFLKIGEDGYPYCMVATNLMDGPNCISSDTLEKMERVAYTFLHVSEKKLRYICNGVLPPKDDDEEDSGPSGIAKGLLHHLMGSSQKPDQDGDDDSHTPHSLLDLLASMESDSDTKDNTDE